MGPTGLHPPPPLERGGAYRPEKKAALEGEKWPRHGKRATGARGKTISSNAVTTSADNASPVSPSTASSAAGDGIKPDGWGMIPTEGLWRPFHNIEGIGHQTSQPCAPFCSNRQGIRRCLNRPPPSFFCVRGGVPVSPGGPIDVLLNHRSRIQNTIDVILTPPPGAESRERRRKRGDVSSSQLFPHSNFPDPTRFPFQTGSLGLPRPGPFLNASRLLWQKEAE